MFLLSFPCLTYYSLSKPSWAGVPNTAQRHPACLWNRKADTYSTAATQATNRGDLSWLQPAPMLVSPPKLGMRQDGCLLSSGSSTVWQSHRPMKGFTSIHTLFFDDWYRRKTNQDLINYEINLIELQQLHNLIAKDQSTPLKEEKPNMLTATEQEKQCLY